jgi:hydrogenase maturation protein HypF
VDYEAQAAVEMEMAATDAIGEIKTYPFSTVEQDGVSIVKLKEMFEAIINDIDRLPVGTISLGFHHTIAQMTAEMCKLIAKENELCKVALSGGVFQNRLLSRLTINALEEEGFEVLTHSLVPTNDGGISLGQAVIAFSTLA